MAPKKEKGDSRSSGRPGSRPTTQGGAKPASAKPEEEAAEPAPPSGPVSRLSVLRSADCSLRDVSPGGFVAALVAEAGPEGNSVALQQGLAAVFDLGRGPKAKALAAWHTANIRLCRRLSIPLYATAECLLLLEAVRQALCAPADALEGLEAAAALLRQGVLRLGSTQRRTALRSTPAPEATPKPPTPKGEPLDATPAPGGGSKPGTAGTAGGKKDVGKPPLPRKASAAAGLVAAAATPVQSDAPLVVPATVDVREEVVLPPVLGAHEAERVAAHCVETLLRKAGLHRFVARRQQARDVQHLPVRVSYPQPPLPLLLAKEGKVHEAWERQQLVDAAESLNATAGDAVEMELEELRERCAREGDEHGARGELVAVERDERGELHGPEYDHCLGALKYQLGKLQKGGDDELSARVAALRAMVDERLAGVKK